MWWLTNPEDYNTRAELVRVIRDLRSGLHSASGWSWRAAGYPYDPDETGGRLPLIAQLEEKLERVRTHEEAAVLAEP